MLTAKEAQIVDPSKIEAFANSALASRMAASANVQKEKRFNYQTEYEGSRVIIRGIIDCFFEEDGGWVLLDYKTGNAAAGSDSQVAERYRAQMELYRQALEAATGRPVKEIYLYLTDACRFVRV